MKLEAFKDEYLPETVIDREKEKIGLKEYLENVLKGRIRAFYIHDPPEVGKTVVTKHVLNQFEDSFNSEVVYINSQRSTPNQALREVYNAIGGDVERRIPSRALVSAILRRTSHLL
ncbi:orc1/cdc6 family replication initiation protein [Candidatus Bathyarchaeota archaeon]|nr:orc1/cdc6 family replication initiation protein [Candidatus Bathyarchaeota archaeon]MBS7627550.1 orc1/cdc6 family replication initiation protein [Candidatus Bathyarchaeota archaeon]